MRDVYKMIGRLATIDVPALVLGEHGTGKQLVTATIHENSARRDRPFLSIDCGTLPEAAIEASCSSAPPEPCSWPAWNLAARPAVPAALALGRRLARRSRLQARVIASTEPTWPPGRRRGRSAVSCIRRLA